MAVDSTPGVVLSFLLLTTQCLIENFVRAEPQVPCYFIFGDSLADNGNNNGLVTQAKANYPPYGVDFHDGFTGRFTNNRTIPDIIGQLLGFSNFITPFANITGNITKGVNYASGVSGIRDETGMQQGERVNMRQQLRNHHSIVLRIINMMRNKSAARQHLGKCIYVLLTGNNDYINNYFMPNVYPTSKLYTPQRYADLLVKKYIEQLKRLYLDGARKVAIFGVGLVGQTPTMIKRFGSNFTEVNAAAQLFSNRLLPLVNDFNNRLPDAKFTYINTTGITITSSFERLNVIDTCCPVDQELGTCTPGSTPCPDRSRYAFFDGFHPTDVANQGLAGRAYKETLPQDASPYDIHQLAQLQ